MPLPRSTSVNLKSRRFLRKRTSSRTDPSFPERRSLLPCLVLPRVCVKLGTTQSLSRNVLLDSWLKRRPNGKLVMSETRLPTRLPRPVQTWMWIWTMELPLLLPPVPQLQSDLLTPSDPVLSTVHPDPIDNLSVWPLGNRISKPTNFEISPRENQTGWQRLPSPIDMFLSRDQNGCWLERERVERRIDDSLFAVSCPSFALGVPRFLFTTCMALYVYSAFCYGSRRSWLLAHIFQMSLYASLDRA